MLIASTPARSDWMMVDANDDATVLVQLSDYLSQPPKENLTFLMNFNAPIKHIGREFNSAVNMAEVDCQNLRYKVLGFKNYSEPMGQGQITFQTDKPTAWKMVFAGTMEYSLWKVACE
jgi:hypothetical protein